jgi:large subunit ribosomal protein L21
MFAIVNIAGQQFKVQEDQSIIVHRLEAKEGDKVDFSDILLIDDDGKVDVGFPSVSGAKITASVISHLRGDKVLVFKKKRRKGYQKLNGHRQDLTRLKIEKIAFKGAKKSSKKKLAAETEE